MKKEGKGSDWKEKFEKLTKEEQQLYRWIAEKAYRKIKGEMKRKNDET